MTRCDYDTVFYRVFCVTLLAIAFTFTVILTNVFVDIDGLLASKKDKLNVNTNPNDFTKPTTEASDNDENNYSESDDSYRTKRSIETQSYLFHIKNPKVKDILANRLSTLLEELEAEESVDARPEEKITERSPQMVVKHKTEEEEEEKKHDKLHTRLHNIILQGIATHMDLNNVFRTIHTLMPTVTEDLKVTEEPTHRPMEIERRLEEGNNPPKIPLEDRFLDEMLNCHKLHKQILHSTTTTTTTNKPLQGPPKVMIKTVIDISSVRSGNENDTKVSNENIQGDIELVYNGKVIKFTRTDTNIEKPEPRKETPHIFKLKSFKPKPNPVTMTTTTEESTNDYKIIPKSYMDKFVEEYFKHFPHDNKDQNNDVNQHFETKRLKRHVRIKYENENSGEAKNTHKKNTEEDELYVEIETHFDSKGMKGEKKKKIVKNLIEKIQKAIHSDMTNKLTANTKNNTSHHKRIHFRKRVQNPLIHGNLELFNGYNRPLVHRQIHPIGKIVHSHIQEPRLPSINTGSEERYSPNFAPPFLSETKNINSAEIGEVKVDYSKILEVNGIPQRLQQPLNTELSEETIKTNAFYDIGNSKYVIKDIDGSGFSIGFNQYVDNPPDPEAMRIFAGLENMIKSYHQSYDPPPTPEVATELNLNDEEASIEAVPYNERLNEHTIERRSINKNHDYHSNEYKIIFDKDAMPYDSYYDVYNTKLTKSTPISENKLPLILDENIFERNLKPSEILSLANLFQRRKRSINYKQMLTKNLNHKPVNKFLNTNAMSTKTIFLNKKRNKRQINKIRIIATDMPQNYRHSDENVFVISGENIFADRAIIKDAEVPDVDRDKHEDPDPGPYQNNESESYIAKILKRRSRQNPLMSKYPHVFMEEVSRSGEEFHFPNNVLLPGFGKQNPDNKIDVEQPFMMSPTNDTDILKQLQEQELVNTSVGDTNSNYKVTVKIIPKNESDLHSGFKEMHTTINKSFNKNGLLYSSLVNVSEISKVMNLSSARAEEIKDRDKEFTKEESFLSKKIYDQQEKMQFLLKEHARHISDQLNRLQQEKLNLEYILSGNKTDIKTYKTMPVHSQPTTIPTPIVQEPTVPQATEDTQEVPAPIVNKQSRKVFSQNTIQSTTPDTQPPIISNKLKEKDIITTIERNGNLTDQILKKIDRNTAILQIFLNKLTERIDPLIPTTSQPERDDNAPPLDWRNQGIQFAHNMIIRKNDSHISIPFSYAYPPSTSLPVKEKRQLGNIIYQGHIRNFNVHNGNQHTIDNGLVNKISDSSNQSRFFIDGLESDYKVIQLGEFKKSRDYKNNLIHVNSTLA